ncbi:GNAT family N-acetyltransferase [Thermomonospora catenispora]|uniref:GNAT family N-acetyltransferase n=1 Tax=Thermomonospora catenispora TaxID=2493090 RepID=UPI0015886442|nr:GNAT family N-acetyltransferase [Thermomonospora catenispora]
MTTTRLLTLDDAPVLAELVRLNRDFLTPWEPLRSEEYYTPEGQLAEIREALERYEQGSSVPHVIVDDHGRVVGRITLSGIVRGAFQSCSAGYWVSAHANGRGHATAAVREMVRLAFEDLGLHRVQAEILPHNVRSRRVLERNGFVRIGLAPAYLNINGRWQDHILYQKVRPDP